MPPTTKQIRQNQNQTNSKTPKQNKETASLTINNISIQIGQHILQAHKPTNR